jgi:hypothetical protein
VVQRIGRGDPRCRIADLRSAANARQTIQSVIIMCTRTRDASTHQHAAKEVGGFAVKLGQQRAQRLRGPLQYTAPPRLGGAGTMTPTCSPVHQSCAEPSGAEPSSID